MTVPPNTTISLPAAPIELGGSSEGGRYEIRSTALRLHGFMLSYEDGTESHLFDLSELYLPATTGYPMVSRISDYPAHVDTLLAAADLRIERSKDGLPSGRAITRQIYLIRHLLDWLRARGVYKLCDATENDTRQLLKQLAHGGWAHALSIETRWNSVIDQLITEGDDLANAFHFKNVSSKLSIETLRQTFWRSRLGWGGIVPVTPAVKKRLEQLGSAWPLTDGWTRRKVNASEAPSTFVLRNTIGWLNDLTALPTIVDRLRHRVAQSTIRSSKKISKRASERTQNLQLEDAITLFRAATELIYETAPLLTELYKSARTSYPDLSHRQRRSWLHESRERQQLESQLGKKITNWVWSGHHSRHLENIAVDELLAAVQGACAIVLAAMNARRQGEICDRHRGVRVGDLVVLDDSLGLYQCWFYIEKTYRDRHVFYVNKTSADALRCLEELKKVCAPFDNEVQLGSSLFECGRFVELGPTRGSNFSFSEDNGRTRSLMSFLKIVYGADGKTPEIASHMFRRFFAILYYHRYEHAELRALKQHLRHLDVAMTRVYVTDPSSRPLAEQISTALEKPKFRTVGPELKESLESDAIDIQNALAELSTEKLRMAVDEILNGTPTGGGFTKIVRKLYRRLINRTTIVSGGRDSAPGHISDLLKSHGYQVNPMQHGQCHAPDHRRNLKGACEQNGVLARERASAHVCSACPFHYNNSSYLENLREQLRELVADRENFLLSPQQQARAQFDAQNLQRVIFLAEQQMVGNSKSIRDFQVALS